MAKLRLLTALTIMALMVMVTPAVASQPSECNQ